MFDASIQYGLKQVYATSPLFFNSALEYANLKVQEQKGTGIEWDTPASGAC
jgi:hypothetical protein